MSLVINTAKMDNAITEILSVYYLCVVYCKQVIHIKQNVPNPVDCLHVIKRTFLPNQRYVFCVQEKIRRGYWLLAVYNEQRTFCSF